LFVFIGVLARWAIFARGASSIGPTIGVIFGTTSRLILAFLALVAGHQSFLVGVSPGYAQGTTLALDIDTRETIRSTSILTRLALLATGDLVGVFKTLPTSKLKREISAHCQRALVFCSIKADGGARGQATIEGIRIEFAFRGIFCAKIHAADIRIRIWVTSDIIFSV